MKRFKQIEYTLLLICVIYHCLNFPWKGKIHRPWLDWQNLRIQTQKHSITLQVPTVKSHRFLDATTEGLSRTGYALRFISNEFPLAVMVAESTNVYKFASKLETKYLYPKVTQELCNPRFWESFRRFITNLKSVGVKPVVVLIPSRLSIERESWPKKLPPYQDWEKVPENGVEDGDLAYHQVFKELGADAIDLYDLFRKEHLKTPNEFLYLAGDYHWASNGITLAAKEVVQRLTGKTVNRVLKGHELFGYYQWILHDLQLPDFFQERQPKLNWRQPFYELEDATGGLEPRGRLVHMGTSFSGILSEGGYDFANLLSRSMGRELVSEKIPGGAVTGALKIHIEKGLTVRPGDYIVWEFPLSSLNMKLFDERELNLVDGLTTTLVKNETLETRKPATAQ